MGNRIDELLTRLKEEEGIAVPEFAKRCGLPPTTIYNARKREDIGNISIDVFLKIAHGLGMTAEELYYGKRHDEPPRTYADARQREINDVFESVTEDGRHAMWTNAVMARATFPEDVEGDDFQEAQ